MLLTFLVIHKNYTINMCTLSFYISIIY
ncbi:hypothetical protein, partial [Plasmodium yoelii yoelii]